MEVLQNFFPKSRYGELDSEIGGLVVLVNDRIHFHDLKTQHASVIRDDLHSQVGFTIRGAAANWSTYSRRIFGIDPIHVERDMVSGGIAAGQP